MSHDSKILNFFNSGLYSKAISYWKSKIAPSDETPTLINMIAACFFKLGEYSQAQTLLMRLEPLLAEDPNFLSLYASNSRLQGDLTRSQSLFESALKIDPDSPLIRNNYANLLIDMHKYSEANEILESLLAADPSYTDARVNFNRLQFLKSKEDVASDIESLSNLKAPPDGFSLADPLLLAFADHEIDYAKKRYKLHSSSSVNRILDHIGEPSNNHTNAELLLLARQSIEDKNFDFCLKLCSQLIASGFVNSDVYDCASDAYLNLNRLKDSEICLLHAVSIGGGTPKQFLNLVSFSCIRSDFRLANYYLERVAQMDPSHPQLKAITLQVAQQSKLSQKKFNFIDTWSEPALQQ